MSSTRKLLRLFLETSFGVPPRACLDFLEYQRARGIVEDSARSFGWNHLTIETISQIRGRKNSDTLYILGSGSSVNTLSDEMWQEIARHVSVGINHWTLHQFVPDIYAVETVPNSRRADGESKSAIEIDHLNHLQVLNRAEVLESDAIIMCLAPRTEGENMQVLELPASLYSKTYIYYRFTPFTRIEKNIAGDYSRGLGFLGSRSSKLVVPDSGASLVRLLGIALKAGFKEVVLVGIDLSTTYFWEESSSRLINPRFRGFAQPMTGPVHETVRTENRPFSVVTVMEAMKEIYRSRGVSLDKISRK